MPLILLVILIVLIAQFGFWDTVQSILGAFGAILLFTVLAGLLLAGIARYLWGRVRPRDPY